MYKNISASTLIKTGQGVAVGVIINSHSSGTLTLEDAITDTTPLICNVITFATGERNINLYGAKFLTGLYAKIGGTADITIVYN